MCPTSSLNSLHNPPSPSPPTASLPTTTIIPDYIPPDEICTSAYNLAAANLPTAILNHSGRVYFYAAKLAQHQASIYGQKGDSPSSQHALLFVACILHDIGCAPRFDGPQRFEVEGADAAKAHVLSFGRSEAEAHDVWVAIACHTSPHIAEKISPLACLVRVSVLFDFMETRKLAGPRDGAVEALSQQFSEEVEERYPRLEPEKVLGDVVVEQARRQRAKAPAASWPGVLLRAAEEDPGWEGVNKAF
jgi:hypothetical protein